MMREIKFRAWDKEKKIYFHFENICMIWRSDVAYRGSFPLSGIMIASHSFHEEKLSKEGYEWELFTGIKDKNGKEIYEGDIITKTEKSYFPLDRDEIMRHRILNPGEEDPYQMNTETGVVIYKRCEWWVATMRDKEGEFTERRFALSRFLKRHKIGNIHECPEKLSEAKD